MSNVPAAGAAAAAAAIAQATKASGVIVRVEPDEFMKILELNDEPLVVHATGGFFKLSYQYLTSYRGLAFFRCMTIVSSSRRRRFGFPGSDLFSGQRPGTTVEFASSLPRWRAPMHATG
jgi:hypothetical protein